MTVVNVFAFMCLGVGAAFMFGAMHTVESTFTSFETAALGGLGAILLLGTFLLLRR